MRLLSLFLLLLLTACSSRNRKVVILFDNVEGLNIDSRMLIKGVEAGRITNIDFYKNKVAVDVRLNSHIEIPAGSVFYAETSLLAAGCIRVEPSANTVMLTATDTVAGIYSDKKPAVDSLLQQRTLQSVAKIIEGFSELLHDTTLLR